MDLSVDVLLKVNDREGGWWKNERGQLCSYEECLIWIVGKSASHLYLRGPSNLSPGQTKVIVLSNDS